MNQLSEYVRGRGSTGPARLGSWCGETHIQKTSYVAKCVEHVPFESEFVLYKHGPYSFDLNAVLNRMRSQGIITLVPQGSYGASYHLNERIWAAINKATGNYFDQFASRVERVCARSDVVMLRN